MNQNVAQMIAYQASIDASAAVSKLCRAVDDLKYLPPAESQERYQKFVEAMKLLNDAANGGNDVPTLKLL